MNKLKMILKAKGYTQADMARKINMPFRTFQLKINDPARFTHIERRKLARILQVKMEDIV